MHKSLLSQIKIFSFQTGKHGCLMQYLVRQSCSLSNTFLFIRYKFCSIAYFLLDYVFQIQEKKDSGYKNDRFVFRKKNIVLKTNDFF